MPILSQESDCKAFRKNPQCIQEKSSQRSECKFCERLQSNRKINEVRIHPPTWLLHRHHTLVTTSANIRGSKQPSPPSTSVSCGPKSLPRIAIRPMISHGRNRYQPLAGSLSKGKTSVVPSINRSQFKRMRQLRGVSHFCQMRVAR